MLGRKHGRQPARLPIRRRVINQAAEAGEFEIVAEPPLELIRLGRAWLLRLIGPGRGTLVQVKTPPGGIPGRVGLQQSSADCYVVEEDAAGLMVVTAATLPVWNYAGGAIAGDGFGVAGWVNGKWKWISGECGT